MAFNGDFHILVCGAREWDDYGMIREVIADTDRKCRAGEQQLHVICGAQRKEDDSKSHWVGADWLAIEACIDLQIPFHGYPAQWKIAKELYGKNWRRAGIDRNAWQLHEHRHHLVEGHAFHDNIASSKGTKDMVNRLIKAQVPYIIHAHN